MDYVRIGGVCLLLMVLAAALPADVLAQASESSSGAAPSISHSLLSGSSAQESSISAETLSKRNIGLKPLGSKGSAPSSAAASDQSAAQASSASAATATQAATAPAAAPATTSQVSSQQESSGSATTPVSNDIITPDQISQDTVAADASTDSAAATPAEAASSGTSSTSGSASEVVTPPEDVAAGTVVSATDSAADASNAAAENATDEQPTDELTAENESENQTESEEEEEEEIEVGEKNRIWSEGSSLKYTWTPETFSGFFYDLENEVGTERLTVDLVPNERSLESGQLTYSTKPQVTDFEFEDWGEYEVIGFMAEKYFAGFKASDILSDDRSLINDGQLRRVLVDSDEEKTVTTGSVLPLEEGYELRIKQIDIDGNKVYMALAKDGDEIDSKVIDPSNL
ncbi:MAG: S-layer protein domain-containing protein, partial [Methanothrix soehngenii]